jgi:predicted HicB family RNase H-like nuclease
MSEQSLTHKGYTGSAGVSLEDDCLHGKVLFISDLVTYEAETVPGLRTAFKEAVENYLAHCADKGLPADEPLSTDERRRRA